MLYNLYSFLRADSGYSLSPMGLSELGYNGHVFRDADIWMFPGIIALHPEMATGATILTTLLLQTNERRIKIMPHSQML